MHRWRVERKWGILHWSVHLWCMEHVFTLRRIWVADTGRYLRLYIMYGAKFQRQMLCICGVHSILR